MAEAGIRSSRPFLAGDLIFIQTVYDVISMDDMIFLFDSRLEATLSMAVRHQTAMSPPS